MKLKNHLDRSRKKAVYSSPNIQNEIIRLCGEVIKERIIEDSKQAKPYVVIVDETADIAGKENIYFELRFYDENQKKIREEFVGYVELKCQDASTIATTIRSFLVDRNLSVENCVGFGFDRCSTKNGKEGGVHTGDCEEKVQQIYFFPLLKPKTKSCGQ